MDLDTPPNAGPSWPTPDDFILTTYARGLPYEKLVGTTDFRFIVHPSGWMERDAPGGYKLPRTAASVGPHLIHDLLGGVSDQHIAPVVQSILSFDPAIVWLDLKRIYDGFPLRQPGTVVLVVMVEENSMSWDHGCALADAIYRFVRERCPDLGPDDMHCEVFEVSQPARGALSLADFPRVDLSSLMDAAASAPAAEVDPSFLLHPSRRAYNANSWSRVYSLNILRRQRLMFSPYLGQPITTSYEPELSAVTGLYVRLSKGGTGTESAHSFNALIISRHLVFSESSPFIVNQLGDDYNTAEPISVFQVPELFLAETHRSTQYYIKALNEVYDRNKQDVDTGRVQRTHESDSRDQEISSNITESESFLAHYTSHADINSRRIGDIVATAGRHGDWALVKMSENTFGTFLPRNRGYIADLDDASQGKLRDTGDTLLLEGRKRQGQEMCFEDFLELKTYFTMTDIEERGYLGPTGMALPVYKFGTQTRGRTGSLGSLAYKRDGEGNVKRMYSVVSNDIRLPFSFAGDNGAVIFAVLPDDAGNLRAGAIGFVCGCHGKVSYVVPFEDVKDSIEMTGWRMHLA